MISWKKILIFGAGKIGRSLIGQLFSHAGYDVVFADISEELIRELNQKHEYEVIIRGKRDERQQVRNVRGIEVSREEDLVKEIASAGLVAVSVGQAGLAGVFPILGKAIRLRLKDAGSIPLDIIIAENMRNGDRYFLEELKKFLPDDFPSEAMPGLIETSIGKMVPVIHPTGNNSNLLTVYAEPYNKLILNRKGFRNPLPDVPGLEPREPIKAWVDRKLFIHNLGHAAVAYSGFLHNQDCRFIADALKIPNVRQDAKGAMQESAEILRVKYPGIFTQKELQDHIEDLLERFANPYLGDTLYRVGCDLMRKLGPDDRIAGAIKAALELNLPYGKVLNILYFAMDFTARDEEGKLHAADSKFHRIRNRGIKAVLLEVCGFSREEAQMLLQNVREDRMQ